MSVKLALGEYANGPLKSTVPKVHGQEMVLGRFDSEGNDLQHKNIRKRKAAINARPLWLKSASDAKELITSRKMNFNFNEDSKNLPNTTSAHKATGKVCHTFKFRIPTKSSSKKLVVKIRKLEDFQRKEKKEAKCTICSSTFNLTLDLDLHTIKSGHVNERNYKCSYCPKSYYNQLDLNWHQRLCIYSNIKCKWCKKVLIFRTISSYHVHIGNHMKKKVHSKRKTNRTYNRNEAKPEPGLSSYSTRYKCVVCSLFFTKVKEFQEHSEKEGHVNLRLIQCKQCPKRLYNETDLYLHSRRTHRDMQHKCPHCGKCFKNSEYLAGHVNEHTGEKPYKCDKCGAAFTHLHKLYRHKVSHGTEFEFKCQLCNSQYKNELGLQRHMLTHNGLKENKFICNSCDQRFSEQRCFIAHQIDEHGMQSPFTCKHCQQAFSYRKDLIVHVRHTHGEEPSGGPKSCDFCGKVYNYEPSLIIHVLSHLNVSEDIMRQVSLRGNNGSYQCEECGKVFTYKHGLTRHWKKLHAPNAAERRIKCDICGKVTADISALKKHKAFHEKDFVCEICGKRYAQNYHLQSHKKTHQ